MPTSLIDTSNSLIDLLSEQGPETLRNVTTQVVNPTLPTIAGYEVLEEIGRGGMGIVYRARDPELKRLVAIKMLLDPEFASAEQRMRFKIEAEAVAQLRHPNIVQVYELGEMPGSSGNIAHPYMVLEFIEGPTLFRHIRQKTFSERESAALMITLARAVQHAHDHGLIHRDLKPANILLHAEVTTESGTQEMHRLLNFMPKITDFGLVKALVFDGEARRDLTRPELMVGTPQYMAPEQANPTAVAVTCSVDIYSLGVIFYELLTGQLPYDDKDILKMLMDVQTKEPVSPRKLQPRLSMDLETICLKCLEKNPQHRYPSAAAMADDLTRFLNHEPIQARPLSEWQRITKWVQRYPLVASLAAILFSVITIALVVIGFLWRQADADRQQAVEKSHDAELSRDVARTAEQSARDAEQGAKASELSARQSLYFSRIAQADLLVRQGQVNRPLLLLNSVKPKQDQEDRRGWEWYHLRQMCNPMENIIKTPMDYVRVVAYHPSQEYFFCIEAPENFVGKRPEDYPSRLLVFKWDKKTSQWLSKPLYDSHMPLRHMKLALNGTKAVLSDMDGKVVVVDVDVNTDVTKQAYEVTQLPRHQAWNLADEAGIVLLRNKNSPTLEFYDLKEERVNREMTMPAEVQEAIISSDGKRVACVLKNQTVSVWDVDKKTKLWEEKAPEDKYKLAIDQRGVMLALLGESNGSWRWWNIQTGKLLQSSQHQTNAQLMFSNDGKRLGVLVSAYSGGEAQIWRLKQNGTVDTLPVILRGHLGSIMNFAFHPNGQQLATCGADGSVRLWDTSDHDLKAGQCQHLYRGHTGSVLSVAFDPRSSRLISGGMDANILVWNTNQSVDRDQLEASTGSGGEWISAIGFVEGTKQMAVFEHMNSNLILVDLDTRKVLKRHKLENVANVFRAPRYDTAFTSDGKHLALSNPKWDRVKLFDTLTGKLEWESPETAMRILRIHLSGDGKRLLMAGHFPDTSANAANASPRKAVPYLCGYQVWDIETRKLVHDGKVPANFIGWNINYDGSRVAAILRHPKEVYTLSVFLVNEQGKEALRIPTNMDYAFNLAFSPDGKWIAASNFHPQKNNIVLWNAETGKQVWRHICVFESTDVAFTRDSKRVLNTGYSSDVIIFDTFKGHEVLTLKNYGTPRVGDYALSPKIVFNQDETLLAVHSWDAGISFWHAYNPAKYNLEVALQARERAIEAEFEASGEVPSRP